MYNKLISDIKPLGFTWETSDPFLFCVHHLDNYPAGNDELGPAASLEGRNIGQDFTIKDGWRMYHGNSDAFCLLLQGRPINEPVAQHGPFVMNNALEIQQAFSDYRETQFGGWPWKKYDNVHPPEKGRFAMYSDGPEQIK